MSPLSRTNKILIAVVVIALIAAIGVLIYAYLPQGGTQNNNNNNNNQNTPPPTGPYINVTVDGLTRSYTPSQMWALGNFTGGGGYRTNASVINGVGNYTGIPIKNLIASLGNQTHYSLNITAGDGRYHVYDVNQVAGKVSIFDSVNASNATPIGEGGVMMVLIYAYNGQPLNATTDDYFKIGYLSPQENEPLITAGYLWLKDVRTIQIIT